MCGRLARSGHHDGPLPPKIPVQHGRWKHPQDSSRFLTMPATGLAFRNWKAVSLIPAGRKPRHSSPLRVKVPGIQPVPGHADRHADGYLFRLQE